MIPINNSDTAWLITADYNQDNDIGYPDSLREDVLNPDVNDWNVTYSNINNNPGSNCIVFAFVGDNSHVVGGGYGGGVGVSYEEVGDITCDSILVGGNNPD